MSKKPQKIFAIGDVHGCATELKLLLDRLPLTPDCQIVFVGDYVDRGNESKQVLDLILELRKTHNIVTLRGNHEAMFQGFLDEPGSENAGLFILNGGTSTLASYSSPEGKFRIPEEHVEFLRGLEMFYQTDEYFFVHAGVPNVALKDIDGPKHEGDLLWIRTDFFESRFDWGKTIVHGHTPIEEALVSEKRINIDTGCVFEGHLTAIELPENNLYSIKKLTPDEHRTISDPEKGRIALRFEGEMPVFIDRSGEEVEYVTLNYNEFGMLLRNLVPTGACSFTVNEEIEGMIGPKGHNQKQIFFKGQVVRVEKRSDGFHYGVKMLEPLRGRK